MAMRHGVQGSGSLRGANPLGKALHSLRNARLHQSLALLPAKRVQRGAESGYAAMNQKHA